MKLKQALIFAIVISSAVLLSWEIYCRHNGYIAAPCDDKAIWAVQRARLENMSSNGVAILGSSRAHFDIQLDQWEDVTGIRPVMLACDGSTPTPIFQDIVDNSNYNGTLVIGVMPSMFFFAPIETLPMWRRPIIRVDHYHHRTYAERVNHALFLPIDCSLALLNASEEAYVDNIDLKSLINRLKIPNDRIDDHMPPFHNFSHIDIDRNVTMIQKTVDDKAFAARIQHVWKASMTEAPRPMIYAMIHIYKTYVARYEGRGGRVIFLRLPSGGWFRQYEKKAIPREVNWQVLLTETGAKGYHFEDYDGLNRYDPPEWSHLATPDAKQFTRDLAAILVNDNVIPYLK